RGCSGDPGATHPTPDVREALGRSGPDTRACASARPEVLAAGGAAMADPRPCPRLEGSVLMPNRPTRRARQVGALALAGLALLSRTSVADDLPPPSETARDTTSQTAAREKYRAGAAAYKAGHYKDAIDLFLDANRLSPSAALSFDVARAYEKLGDAS